MLVDPRLDQHWAGDRADVALLPPAGLRDATPAQSNAAVMALRMILASGDRGASRDQFICRRSKEGCSFEKVLAPEIVEQRRW